MRWNSRGLYALLALAVTVIVSIWTPAPGEKAVTELLGSMPGDAIWEGFRNFVGVQWTFALAVFVVMFAMYFFFPPREVMIPLAALAGGVMLVWILTSVVDRPTPGISGLVNTDSFPSEGAMMYAAWLGGVALVCIRKVRSDLLRKTSVAVLVALIALGGVAWVESGAHWFLDVAGSWLWATAWLTWLHVATRGVSS